MIKLKKPIILISLIILTICILTSNVLALENPGFYEPDKPTVQEAGSFLSKIEIVLAVVKNIGIIVSVITLSIIGLKYLFGSVEGKAEYKKTMWPYLAGVAMLISCTIIVSIIQNVVG